MRLVRLVGGTVPVAMVKVTEASVLPAALLAFAVSV